MSTSQNTFEGTSANDTIVGSGGNDTINGGAGNDTISGGNGNDTISGGAGGDNIDGGAGQDVISGGSGDDILNGGAGSDWVSGDSGNDTVIFLTLDNVGAADIYDGGSGTDTLLLKLTQAQLAEMNASTVFADFRAAVGKNTWFDFSHYGFSFDINLTVRSFEAIQTIVIAAPNTPPVANGDFTKIDEDGAASVNGNVLANDTDGGVAQTGLSIVGAGVLTGLYGKLTLNADGSYSYVLDNANAAVDALNTGDALQDVFSYTVTDGAAQDTAQVTIAIHGHTDLLPLFTSGDDVTDFNAVTFGTYLDRTQYYSLDGNDTVILPGNAAEAAEAGYVIGTAFHTGDGQNTAFGGALDDVIIGGSGSDTFDGGAGNDIFLGGDGDDVLAGDGGDDRIDAESGNDLIIGGEGYDRLDGGEGINRLVYEEMNVSVTVRLGDGYTRKGEGPDAIGSDSLFNFRDVVGSNFGDTIIGDDQDNFLFGGRGNDVLEGGRGADYLDGGEDRNILFGDDGDDVLVGGGSSRLDGGDGSDTADYSGTLPGIQVNLFDGFAGTATGSDFLTGIENVIGSQGDDWIMGNGGDNRITGFLGNDRMTGAAGRDVFQFDLSGGGNVGNDVITDFEIGLDQISVAGGLQHDLADLNARQVGDDVELDLGNGARLTLPHINVTALTNGDFVF